MTPPRTVEDVEGPWVAVDFDSGLIERCRTYWSVPVSEMPNQALATYIRQRIALSLVVPEARKRVESGFDDDTENFDGELREALQKVEGS